MDNEELINEILHHLDSEISGGVVRMSVEFDDQKLETELSHKCCNMYGKPANETVALLDCYTDRNSGPPDNERR